MVSIANIPQLHRLHTQNCGVKTRCRLSTKAYFLDISSDCAMLDYTLN